MSCVPYITETTKSALNRIAAEVPFDIVGDVLDHLRVLADNPLLGTYIDHGPLKGRWAYAFRVERLPAILVLTAFFRSDEEHRVCIVTDLAIGDETKFR